MKKIKFIDLFAGIGGFRIGFERNNFKCVFSSEFDKHCVETYKINYGDTPFGDITKINSNDIPKYNILVGGFPCQPFSISGHKKGFEDTRGTLFFEIARIISDTNPDIVLLENVKHLINHDKKRTLKKIIEVLVNLNYNVSYEVMNANAFGLPQNRERIFIVAVNKNFSEIKFDFSEMKNNKDTPKLKDFLEKYNGKYLDPKEYTIIKDKKTQKSGLIFAGYINKKIRTSGVRPNTEHLSRVHKMPNRIYSIEGVHPTLSSQEPSGRYYVYDEVNNNVRKLTLKECYKIMGYPEDFVIHYKISKAYNQIGNSVPIPVVEAIAKKIKETYYE